MSSESVSDSSFGYSAGQAWDAAGRRTILSFGGADYNFAWQADGNLNYASDGAGSGFYSFDASGILTNRAAGNRQTSITSRDGEGRPLLINTTVNTLSTLFESLWYSGDGLLTSDTLYRPDFTDLHSYNYASLTRRLTQEQLNVSFSSRWTNSFVYDQGASGGLGVLTAMGQIGQNSGLWNGAPDAFSRVNAETNNSFSYAAYGHANGQASLSAWLDGNSIPIMGLGTNAMQWRATMDLSRGTHKLEVAAEHPGGFYAAWATNVFTNNVVYEAATNLFDPAGYVTNRVWKSASGTIYHTQSLSWDAHGRLHQVVDRDANNSGYNWTAVYDALGRRLSTITVLVTNNVAYPASSQILNSYFDPEVEFLDLGVQNGSSVTWKLEGPDLNGQYGGLNGVGGLDGTSPSPNLFYPTISDARGDVLGEIISGGADWSPSRPTGYGAVPGYRPAAFGSGADLAQASAWRGKEVDITGLYNLGARCYDPASGRWLSFDPLGSTELDPNGYTFTGGDPIDFFDAEGLDPSAAMRYTPSGWVMVQSQQQSVSLFQAVFPAMAAAGGAKPFTGSTLGDVQFVHSTLYPAMAPILLPGAVFFNPRVQGGLKVVGGATETTAGGLGLATTSETGVGAYVSGLAVLHGGDTIQSGWRQMMSGNVTPSFTQEGLTYITGSPNIGAFGDATLGAGLTLGAGAYSMPRVAAWHDAMQDRYTWRAPPGGSWRQGVGFQMRQQLGIVNSDEELHHWLIPRNQWAKWVPNYVKNQPWNIMVMQNREAHAMVDTAFTVSGVTPYPLPLRLWYGTPPGVRVIGISGGLGTTYAAFESVGNDDFAPDYSGSSSPATIGKKAAGGMQ